MQTPWTTPSAVRSVDYPRRIGGALQPTEGGADVVLLGTSTDWAERVRRALFALHWDFGSLRVGDLGNLRRQNREFVLAPLRDLAQARVVPIIIGDHQTAVRQAQYLAAAERSRYLQLLSVDQVVAVSPTATEELPAVYDRAVYRSEAPQYYLTHIGSQRHLVDPRLRDLFSDRQFELTGLGEARSDLGALEPAIRDADVVQLDIGSVLHAEAPAQVGRQPSGFTLQEASQLCYYAGNSDRLPSFGVYGAEMNEAATQNSTLALEVTAAAYAQLIWYFLHGLSQRVGDYPVTTTGMREYVVDARLPEAITFWRSDRSGRWWVQVPTDQPDDDRHRLVACSYADYLHSSQEGRLSDRIVRAFRRY